MVTLETSEVVLSYGSKRVVDDLDFVIPAGKITAIIGEVDVSAWFSSSPSTSRWSSVTEW